MVFDYANANVNVRSNDGRHYGNFNFDLVQIGRWLTNGGERRDDYHQQTRYDRDDDRDRRREEARERREERREARELRRDMRIENRTDEGRLQDAIAFTISAQGDRQLTQATGHQDRDSLDVPIRRGGWFNDRSLEDVVDSLGGWDAQITIADAELTPNSDDTPRGWRDFPGQVRVEGGTMTVREYVERFYDSYENQNGADLSHVRGAIRANLGVEIADAPNVDERPRRRDGEGQREEPRLRFPQDRANTTLQLGADNAFPEGEAYDTMEERSEALLNTATIRNEEGEIISPADRGILLMREFNDAAQAEGADPAAVQRQVQETLAAINADPDMQHNLQVAMYNVSDAQLAPLPDDVEEQLRRARDEARQNLQDDGSFSDDGEGLNFFEMILGAIAQFFPEDSPIREMIEQWIGRDDDNGQEQETQDVDAADLDNTQDRDGAERGETPDRDGEEVQRDDYGLLGGDVEEAEEYTQEALENDATILMAADNAASLQRSDELASAYLREIDDHLRMAPFESLQERMPDNTDAEVASAHMLLAEQWLESQGVEGVVQDGHMNLAEFNALSSRAMMHGREERAALADFAGLTGVAGSYQAGEPVTQETQDGLTSREVGAVDSVLRDNSSYAAILQSATAQQHENGAARQTFAMQTLLSQTDLTALGISDINTVEGVDLGDDAISDREAQILDYLQPGVLEQVNAIRGGNNSISALNGGVVDDVQVQHGGALKQTEVGHAMG